VIVVDGANRVVVNLTPSSPNCAPNPSTPGSYICTASLNIPGGDHVFFLTTYDGTNGSGNVLSTNSTGTVAVAATGKTTVSIVLEGVVQFVKLTLATPRPLAGATASIALTAILEDADHNIIVGPGSYEHSVTLTTTDAADGPLSKTTLLSPADLSGLTVKYNGADVSSITYAATAAGLPAANVAKAVLTPITTPPTASSSGALTTLFVNNTVYAFVPGSNFVSPNPNGKVVEVPIINGSGILSSGTGHNPAIAGTAGVTACAGDQTHLRLYCINNAGETITVLDARAFPATVLKTIATDALTTAHSSYDACHICSIVYDPLDDAAIIGTGNGIEVYSSAGAHVSTIVADASETMGYNPKTNQVFNPQYGGRIAGLPPQSLDIIDIASRTRYTLTPAPGGLSMPDQGAVDTKTNIALSFEEFNKKHLDSGGYYYLIPIGSAKLDAASHTFTEAQPVEFPFNSGITSSCLLAADGFAIDSNIDVAFFNPEFCPDPGDSGYGTAATVGAGQLPTSATAAPTITSFAFALMPNMPNGAAFKSGLDPHAQAVVFGSFGDYGASFDRGLNYLAITDLKKLLAAPRSPSDRTVVDPTYDLVANKVVTFVPI
jgi:hypothetical protein